MERKNAGIVGSLAEADGRKRNIPPTNLLPSNTNDIDGVLCYTYTRAHAIFANETSPGKLATTHDALNNLAAIDNIGGRKFFCTRKCETSTGACVAAGKNSNVKWNHRNWKI